MGYHCRCWVVLGGTLCLRLLGSRYSLVALLSDVDVHCDNRTYLDAKPLGLLHWRFRRIFLELFNPLCEHVFKERIGPSSYFHPYGHLPRPDLFISVPGWGANLLIIIGCCLAYRHLSQKRWSDVLRLLGSVVGTTAFFALATSLFQPRYLILFRRILHPHLHL